MMAAATTTFSPRVSKLVIIPVDREKLLNALIRLEKSTDLIFTRSLLSLKDICTRHLLLFLGDDHDLYKMHLSPGLHRYVTYDYLTETTNNNRDRLTSNDILFSDSKLLFCRDCSLNDLGASKCRRRKCLANRVRQILDQLSCQLIPWVQGQRFAILENNHTDDDDDDDDPVVFIYLKSNNSRSTNQRRSNHDKHKWIQEHFYILDLLSILRINITRG